MSDEPIGSANVARVDVVIDTHRLEAFSDSVMAVIITIMAFDLKTPMTANWHGLEGRLPALLVYLLSFTFVSIYWNNHHHLLRATKKISGSVMWANLHLLLWLSLIPFATSWVGTEHDYSVPASVYGVVGLGSAIAYFILTRTILNANAGDGSIVDAVGTDVKGMVSPAIYLLGIGLAYVSPYFAYACYTVVALVWFVPDRRFSRGN